MTGVMPLIIGRGERITIGVDRLAFGRRRLSIHSNEREGRERGHRHMCEGKCGDAASEVLCERQQ